MTLKAPSLNGTTLEKELTGVSLFEVSAIPLDEIGERQLTQWEDLHRRALETNAYLSPDFVLSLESHVPSAKTIWILNVQNSWEKNLAGLAVFEECRASRRFPFPHLKAYKSSQSYLTGMLIAQEYESQVLEAIASFLWRNRFRWFGVKFQDLHWEGKLAYALRDLVMQGRLTWFPDWYSERAYLDLHRIDSGIEPLPRKLKKNIERSRRKLREMGRLHWRYVSGKSDISDSVEVFLALEHASWKGKHGTSLLSDAGRERFFKEMISKFAEKKQVFFTELLLDGTVIASTCNFLVGKKAFAFKIAWDKKLAKCSPGILNEVEFLERIGELKGFMDSIDSGSADGAYIDKLWPHRKQLVSGVFVTNRLIIPLMRAMALSRKFKHWVGNKKLRFLH